MIVRTRLRSIADWQPTAATRVVVLAVLIVTTVLSARALGVDPAAVGGDSWNYLAAGERLNAGHPLYALSPGDREVPLRPPYWSVPLLSPPFVAVVWRPLAILGEPAMYLWWLGGFLACTALALWIVRRGTALQLLGLAVLSPVLALTALSGNAAAYLVPLLALRHPATVAIAAAVKLSPALLAPSTGIGRVLPWVVALGVVSLAGAGIQNHLDWLRSVPASAPSPASISGLTGIPPAVVLAGAVVISFISWPAGVLAATFGTPVVYFSTLVMLVLLVTPRPDGAAATSQNPLSMLLSVHPRHWRQPRSTGSERATPGLAQQSPHRR